MRKKDKFGRTREFVELVCAQCQKTYEKQKSLVKSTSKCCSRECFAEVQKRQVDVICLFCKSNFSKAQNKVRQYNFCCRSCKDKSQRLENNVKEIWPIHYGTSKDGIANYRNFVFRNKKNECERCGWSEHLNILQVHHIDRDRKNNKLENLEVLCPNCHATEHWLREGDLEG